MLEGASLKWSMESTVPYDWVISFKPGPVLLGLVFKGESCDSGRGWNPHLTQVRKVVVTLDLLSSSLGAGSLVCSSVTLQCLKRLFITYIRLFLDRAELGPCLALGIWCLLCLLQSSTLRLHTSSTVSQQVDLTADLHPRASAQLRAPAPLPAAEPCKQALLLAAQSTGQHAENIGKPILLMTS